MAAAFEEGGFGLGETTGVDEGIVDGAMLAEEGDYVLEG